MQLEVTVKVDDSLVSGDLSHGNCVIAIVVTVETVILKPHGGVERSEFIKIKKIGKKGKERKGKERGKGRNVRKLVNRDKGWFRFLACYSEFRPRDCLTRLNGILD